MSRKIKSFKSYLNEVAPAVAAGPAIPAAIGVASRIAAAGGTRALLSKVLPRIAGSAFRTAAIHSLLGSAGEEKQAPEPPIEKAQLPTNLPSEGY